MAYTPDQHAALTAWWCLNLPQHQHDAQTDGWTIALNAAIHDIRDGMPVADAITRHDLALDIPAAIAQQTDLANRVHTRERGQLDSLDSLADLGVSAHDVTGDYRCPNPHTPCTRHASRDPHTGREPDCHITTTTMTYHPTPS